MNFLRSVFIRTWTPSLLRFAQKPPSNLHKNEFEKEHIPIQTAHNRLSGNYIEQVR